MKKPATVRVETSGGLRTIRLARPHGNAIDTALVEDLRRAFADAAGEGAVRGVLLAADGKIFCPGLDLVDLTALERPAMDRFMAGFRDLLLEMFTFPKPVVAGLHGHALAGGFVLALTADWRLLREGAMVGLNEVRVGLPLPFGVAHILRDSVHRPRLEEVALLGRNYSGSEAVASGLVHEIAPAGRFEQAARERLEEFASRDLAAFAVTKRYLRSFTADRILAEDAARAGEFLDAWFSPGTRRRIAEVVDGLTRREG